LYLDKKVKWLARIKKYIKLFQRIENDKKKAPTLFSIEA
tara:strand:+ start:14207 stop:14323 length:117 start_codon:yes stop_codon:yes gene_type:complete